MTLSVLLIAIGFVLLYVGGELLVRGAESIALRFGMSPLLVGLTVVALGTSSPELFVSVNAALDGLSDVALGNAVGSNICNIALVLGIGALLRPIKVEAQLMRLDGPILIVCSTLLIVLLLDGVLSKTEGILLTAAIIFYICFSIYEARKDKAVLDVEFADTMHQSQPSLWLSVLLIVVGLAMLKFGSQYFIEGAVIVARNFGIDEALIGLTLIALGTSLPELAATVVASIKGRGDIAIGNAIGSSIFNILGILGVTAIITPISRGDVSWVDLGVMISLAVLLLPMLFTKRLLSRWEGGVLLCCYFGYLILLSLRV